MARTNNITTTKPEYKKVPVYHVYKFLPSRCPNCEEPFNKPTKFAYWGGRKGNTFLQAKINQAKLFRDIFKVEKTSHSTNISNKYNINFIRCEKCANITMIIDYSSRQVLALDEAKRLVKEEGFNYFIKGYAVGNLVCNTSSLSFLASAELSRLHNLFIMGRQRANEEEDPDLQGDLLATEIDPALVEIVKKYREEKITMESERMLKNVFGSSWKNLGVLCRDFLITAEVLKNELISLTETNSSIDFSPAVAAYSKSLEKELLEKIFIGFHNSPYAVKLNFKANNPLFERSLDTLRFFVAGKRELTLGDMAYILHNVGYQLKNIVDNGFSEYLINKITDPNVFFDKFHFPERIVEYVKDYRNRSAHVSKLTKEECLAARAYLVEEPIKLLVVLSKLVVK